MSLTFANFKQTIPSTILAKGRDYLRQGQILDLSFDEVEKVWEAQVQGSALYDTRIEQMADGSLRCQCSCPYDQANPCKHIAAVLYAIEETFPDHLGTKPRKKSAPRQTRHDKLRQRLEKTSREQLVTVLLELSAQDKNLLNQLLIHLDSGDAKLTDYRRVVKDALRLGKGEYGFLDHAGSNRAGRKITELLTQADRWLEAGEVEKAVSVYQAVIDETVPAISHADDSDGLLGGCLNRAVAGLRAGAEGHDEARRKAVFSFCLERGQQKAFYEWDWGWELLTLAGEMVENGIQRTLFDAALSTIKAQLQKAKKSDFYRNFALERVALLQLEMIDQFNGEAAARTFLQAHLHLDRLRIVLIERYITEGALDEAMQLIQDGITTSSQRHLPGLTLQYRALHVKLLQKKGDQPALIDAARRLWLDRGDEECLVLLQQIVPEAEWSSFVEGLLGSLKGKPEQLARLYARENRWQELMTMVQANPQAIRLIETFREPLETRFSREVAELYERLVETILRRAQGRNHYRQAVSYLRRIKKLDPLFLDPIVQWLRQQYSHRPALLDELDRL